LFVADYLIAHSFPGSKNNIYIYSEETFIYNMSGRKYTSGAEKRKKQALQRNALSSTHKLTDFFLQSSAVGESVHDVIDDDADHDADDDDDAVQAVDTSVNVESEQETTVPTFPEKLGTTIDNVTCFPETESVAIQSPQTLDTDVTDPDPAKWTVMNDVLREIIVSHPIQQNLGNFSRSERIGKTQKRFLPPSLFQRRMTNGEIVRREWLAYSPSTGEVFCVPCKLFSRQESGFRNGYSDWKNCQHTVVEHESSVDHRTSIGIWNSRATIARRIDSQVLKQREAQTRYWREVLKRVVETIKFLAERGLPFRGDNESFGSSTNGNYMGILELVAKFDPFLDQHIAKFGNAGTGTPSYLSKTICEEMIHIMGRKLVTAITAEIKAAKYFSITVDSTPDIAHMDQLTFIVRYVQPHGIPVERFLSFIQLHGHSAENMAAVVTRMLENLGLDISNCRGQSYDNAANMSGIYSGLQARIKALNKLAHFVPCAAHSLNLVGTCAAESCTAAVSYFGFVQTLYNFFSASTYRWQKLKDSLPVGGLVVKTLSGTRWSARADAVKALSVHYSQIQDALIEISSDSTQSEDTRCEATRLESKMCKLELVLMTIIWNKILERFNATSKSLQKVNIDLLTCVKLYESLQSFTSELREQFDTIEEKAQSLAMEDTYAETKSRVKKRKRFMDESQTPETHLEPRDNFRIQVFNCILDSISVELQKRVSSYVELYELFGFMTSYGSLTLLELREKATNLVNSYPADLELSFVDEFLQFTSIIDADEDKTPGHMCVMLKRDGGLLMASFPNVAIALRIYLTIGISNCEGERSFSTLSRVKNHLRSTMNQDRLVDLAVMCIESELLRNLDVASVIEEFIQEKNRIKSF